MALSITINKVAVADSFAAGTKIADIVVSGGTSPYSYSLASGGDYFQISGTEVQVINEMNISNIQSFSVFVEDSTSGEPVSGVSEEVYPNITAEIQSRFNSANKIYKITQNIDLGHGILTIPAGCTLDFQGGTIFNGVIVGNNTGIKAGIEIIFGESTILEGIWCVSEAYPEWFGGFPNSKDVSSYINNTLKYFNVCNLSIGTYYIKYPIYLNKYYQKLIGKGINITKVVATDDFDVKDTRSEGNTLDGRIDFENALIIVRRGTKNDSYSITIDPMDNIEVCNLLINGKNKVPTGIEIWTMFSHFHDIQITGTNKEGLLFRRGWNTSFCDIYCYYNNKDGMVFESECNALLLNKLAVAHADGEGIRIESGHSILMDNISIESCGEHGLKVINRTFTDLESYGASRTHVSGLNILGIYLESNCGSEDYANMYFNGSNAIDQVLIRGVYINGGGGRPLYLTASIRYYFILEGVTALGNLANSYIGYIIGQRTGNQSNITLGLDPKKIDYQNNYESKQIAFVRNSPTGSKSFNGINLGINSCILRSEGDFEYYSPGKFFKYYTDDGDNTKGFRLTHWNRNKYTHEATGLVFDYFFVNGFIILKVTGTASTAFTGDINISSPFRVANELGQERVFEVLSEEGEVQEEITTRNYNSIYVNIKASTQVNAKIVYPIIPYGA